MKTINRGWLKRQVERGKVWKVSSYHFDDMHGEERSAEARPVRLMPEDRTIREPGICYLFPSDFSTKSGMAYERSPGHLVLIVHGNCNYDLEVRP